MNHSLDFWQVVEGYIPNCRLIRKKLGVKGKELEPAWALI